MIEVKSLTCFVFDGHFYLEFLMWFFDMLNLVFGYLYEVEYDHHSFLNQGGILKSGVTVLGHYYKHALNIASHELFEVRRHLVHLVMQHPIEWELSHKSLPLTIHHLDLISNMFVANPPQM